MAEGVELRGGAGLGTAPFGSGPGWELDWGHRDAGEAQSAIRAAVDAGVSWVDTAPFYGWGRAEQIVGEALAGLARRPVLLTKCGTVRRPGSGSAEDHSAAAITADLDASLARLGCAHVDVLQLHDPDPAVPIETAWRTVCELIAGGRARAGGLSNHPVDLMERAHAASPVTVVQHQYSLLHRTPESDGVLEWCAEHGATFLAWSPLASGFLADGFDLAVLPPGDFRHRLPWAGPARLDLQLLRGELARIAGEAGLSMTALAIGWVLAKGAKAIVGARTPAEAAAVASYRPLPPGLQDAAENAVNWARSRDR
jgi:aryl-alcohol dehydrogenase-like predicted oxidoreductase